MKKVSAFLFILFLISVSNKLYSQDTIQMDEPEEFADTLTVIPDTVLEETFVLNDESVPTSDEEGDISLVVLFASLMFLVLFFIISIALIFLVVMSVILLAGLGIVSTAVLVGMWQKSYTKAFRTFFYMCNATIYILIGALLGFFINMHYQYAAIFFAISIGAVAGLLLSIPIGAAFLSILRKVLGRVMNDKGDI